MRSSSWNWVTPRPLGISKFGPLWLRPLAVAVPWITVILLLVMMWMISGTLTVAKGVIFELPEGDLTDGAASPLVALVIPAQTDTLVFFDDARYSLNDRDSLAAFGEHLASRVSKLEDRTLVVMADRRVNGGILSQFASVARKSGVLKLLMASQEREARSE